MLTWLSSIVKVPFKWGVFSLICLITLFIIKGNYPFKSISKRSMQSLKDFPSSIPKVLDAATLWEGNLLIHSTFFLPECSVKVEVLETTSFFSHSLKDPLKTYRCTIPMDHLFNLEFQLGIPIWIRIQQPKFGIQIGIPIPMGINLGECVVYHYSVINIILSKLSCCLIGAWYDVLMS